VIPSTYARLHTTLLSYLLSYPLSYFLSIALFGLFAFVYIVGGGGELGQLTAGLDCTTIPHNQQLGLRSQGFQNRIEDDSFVVDGVGAMGTVHSERGLTYYEIALCGHMCVVDLAIRFGCRSL
jgi:hypothetical protein